MPGFTEFLTERAMREAYGAEASHLEKSIQTVSRLEAKGWKHNSGNFTHRDFPGHNLAIAKDGALHHFHASEPAGIYNGADEAHAAVAKSDD